MKSVDLSIIIVNWNGIAFLPTCLKSIVENRPTVDFEVIVVDNSSSDGSREWLQTEKASGIFTEPDQLKVILSEKNLGFGRANNDAIGRTKSPFVFILNPDTVVKADSIDKLLKTIRDDESIGAVAPKLLNQDGTIQPNVWRFPPTPGYFLLTGFKLFKLLPRSWTRDRIYSDKWDYKRRVSVPAFSGAAIMARRSMIDDIGAFDDSIYMYGEDAEWCARINRNGWKTVFEPDAEIYHIGGQSALQRWGAGETRLKEDEAFVMVQRKCVSPSKFIVNQFIRLIIHLSYFLKNKLQRRDTSAIRAIIRCEINAIRGALG